jgi:HAD superfamily hydrolase (TIGR01459 family)
MQHDAIALIDGIAGLADRYDGYVLDVWGVLHDGQAPYPGVVDCLHRLKAMGKRRVILSNAPRRVAAVVARLSEIGIAPDAYDAAFTSGEDAWRHLRRRGAADAEPFCRRLGPRCFHLGPGRDDSLLQDVPIEVVHDIETADFVLVTGPVGRTDSLAQYEGQLARMHARRLPMICANPDLVVINGGRRELCAGGLAQRYEELGGTVRYHGKPHAATYDAVFALMPGVTRERILAVGDSLRTDMAGARAAGIDGLLITGGIHAEEFAANGRGDGRVDAAVIARACRREGVAPVAAAPGLRW